MISITIEGSAQQVREEMRALMGLDRGTPAETPVNEEPAKPTRKPRTAKTETADPKSNPDASAAEPKSETGTSAGAASEEARDLSEKAMRERITQYSAKAGPVALTEMQKAAGAPNGKFSEVMADPEALAKLDALLADAGF